MKKQIVGLPLVCPSNLSIGMFKVFNHCWNDLQDDDV